MRVCAVLQVMNDLVIDRGPSPYITNLEIVCNGRIMTTVQGDGGCGGCEGVCSWRGHHFIKILKKPKAIVQGFFFSWSDKIVEKSNPSESKRKEKLNGACFSCIAHMSREL